MRSVATLLMVAVAVLVQATIVNRLPFDWGPGPDLVLAAVVAVALTTSPAAAAGCGFAAGLAMDIMPPAEHPMGRYALVLCVTAYVVSLLHANTGLGGSVGGRVSRWAALGVVAVASLGVGLGYAFIGLVTYFILALVLTLFMQALEARAKHRLGRGPSLREILSPTPKIGGRRSKRDDAAQGSGAAGAKAGTLAGGKP